MLLHVERNREHAWLRARGKRSRNRFPKNCQIVKSSPVLTFRALVATRVTIAFVNVFRFEAIIGSVLSNVTVIINRRLRFTNTVRLRRPHVSKSIRLYAKRNVNARPRSVYTYKNAWRRAELSTRNIAFVLLWDEERKERSSVSF